MLGIDYSLFGARVLHLGEDLSILNSQGLEFKIISSGAKVDRNILPQKKKVERNMHKISLWVEVKEKQTTGTNCEKSHKLVHQ